MGLSRYIYLDGLITIHISGWAYHDTYIWMGLSRYIYLDGLITIHISDGLITIPIIPRLSWINDYPPVVAYQQHLGW